MIGSPKATLKFLPPQAVSFLPQVSLSYGQAFHIDDPRIGTTAIQGGTIHIRCDRDRFVLCGYFFQSHFEVGNARRNRQLLRYPIESHSIHLD